MIKDNQIFAAPLAGITDRPFRRILREFAPNARLMTEMISCHSLVAEHKNCLRNFDRYDDEGQIGAQIFGAVPGIMADAAKILQDAGAKWIDINMGCPVPKVASRSGAGAHLMQDHILAGKIMEAVVQAVQIPVSIKTRLGWDNTNKNWQDLLRIAAESGVSFAVLHGRTRAQLYVGPAVHPGIDAQIKIPVIANGDIKNTSDALHMLDLGYSGVMLGRQLLGRPWTLGQINNQIDVPVNIGTVVLRHFEYVLDYYGARSGTPMFRKHIAWYSAGIPNATEFRMRINQISNPEEMKNEIIKFWCCTSDF